MKPHFVCLQKENNLISVEGKTTVYNLYSRQGNKAFYGAYNFFDRRYPGLISVVETKGEYRIRKEHVHSGFTTQIILCDKFPTVCVPTTQIELIRKQ